MAATDEARPPQKPEPRVSGKSIIIMIVFVIVLMTLLDILSWATSHGGMFSTVAAFNAAQQRVSSIEVDGSGLRLPILIALGLICIAVCVRIKELDISSRMAGIIFGLIVIGGGFILDGVFDHLLVSRFMAAHGYSRCVAGDFAVGNGKSRVWFEEYVASNEACVTRR